MIELKNVSGGYGRKIIVSDVSAVFPSGEITSVIGSNGCGKSTLLMLCAGLLTPVSGTVMLDGEDISGLSRNAVARKIAYLSQLKSAGSLSVRSLVAHGRFPYLGYPRRYTDSDYEKIDNAMELAGVADISDATVSELSGGQQQRVHIAMMLAQDTDTVLLDEPLTYLDISHQLELMELIVRLKETGKTVITVMHDLNLALTYSDNIAVMKNGVITEFDKPANIVKSNAVSSAMGVRAMYSIEANQYFFKMNN